MSDDIQTAPPEAGNADMLMAEFNTRLFAELGFDKMPAEEQKSAEEKLAKLVNDRIINLLLIYLPEGKVAELDKIIEGGDQSKVTEFLSANISGVEEKIANELMEVRSEIIAKVKNG